VALRREHPSVTLTLCCDADKDFNTPDEGLRREYLAKARHTEGIIMRGRVPRSELLDTVLPSIDVYLLPTYVETFGMAIPEAMAFGKPIVATNHFAIPEMVEDGVSGLLIDNSMFNTEAMFRGYVVKSLPRAFREHVTTALFQHLKALVEVPGLAERIGRAALETARTKFSFSTRNAAMRAIYEQALA
jgi:glycosyltransferase involved in cell wall biosynthesis